MQKIIFLFILVSFVHSKNYCVEKTKGKCKQLCQNSFDGFDMIFDHIPYNDEVISNENLLHNIYIAENVDYYNSYHNFIICDPSIKLIYKQSFSSLSIKNDIISTEKENLSIKTPNSKKYNLLSNQNKIPILFPFTNNLTIDIDLYESKNPISIILEAREPNLYLKPKFLTSKYKRNFISISDNSEKIRIVEITNEVKTLFADITKLEEDSKYYYCISDKETKCPEYSIHDPKYINMPSEIDKYPAVLIVDSSIPQYYSTKYEDRLYMHIICLEGSEITYMPTWSQYADGSYYIIIHEDKIELYNGIFEGKGSFTFILSFEATLHATTEKNNFDFTIATDNPYSYYDSIIRGQSESDFTPLTIEPKIKTTELTIIHGPKHLSGLFESTKYIDEDELILRNVTMETLKEYYYNDPNYYLTNDVHNIPVTWKTPISFTSESKKESTLIFNDTYSYGSYYIDGFIRVFDYKTLIINPKRFLKLIEYPSPGDFQLTINIENDIIVDGYSYDNRYPDEYTKEYCSITGHGILLFINEDYMNKISSYCSFDENNIHLEKFNSEFPNISVCIGQSDLEKCKSKIKDSDLNDDVEWIWLRNVNTLNSIYKYHKAYVTDNQLLKIYFEIEWNIILTAGSNLILTTDKITLYKNGIKGIRAQDPSAKITILNYKQFNHDNPDNIIVLEIIYEEAPTDIDLQIYYNGRVNKLMMNYYKNYVPNSIKLRGKGFLYVREPYQLISDIFDNPDGITIYTKSKPDYAQICYSDEPVMNKKLNDFVLAKTINELIEYDSVSLKSTIFINKDIELPLKSVSFVMNEFIIVGKATVTIDLPNKAILIFDYSKIEIITDKSYTFSIDGSKADVKYIFNVDETIILDYKYFNSDLPLIEFRSSKNSIEMIPNPGFQHINALFKNKLTVQEGISVTSLYPENVKKLFLESQEISFSSKWSYIYLNEEGKSQYETLLTI